MTIENIQDVTGHTKCITSLVAQEVKNNYIAHKSHTYMFISQKPTSVNELQFPKM